MLGRHFRIRFRLVYTRIVGNATPVSERESIELMFAFERLDRSPGLDTRKRKGDQAPYSVLETEIDTMTSYFYFIER